MHGIKTTDVERVFYSGALVVLVYKDRTNAVCYASDPERAKWLYNDVMRDNPNLAHAAI